MIIVMSYSTTNKWCAMWCNSYPFLHHIICLLIYVHNQKLEV